MDANEIISSKILSNVEIIADIYKIVKDAGLAATNQRSVLESHNDVCVIKANQPNTTRFSPCRKSNDYFIEYDANDITIVGGAALNVYDYMIGSFKERRDLGALDSYIKKRT